MKEDKILFQVNKVDGMTAVKLEADDDEEIFCIALAVYDLLDKHPKIAEICAFMKVLAMTDPTFKELKDRDTVKIPDFDKLLKSKK